MPPHNENYDCINSNDDENDNNNNDNYSNENYDNKKNNSNIMRERGG